MQGLHGPGASLAVAGLHHINRRLGCQDCVVTWPCVVGVTVRDHGAGHLANRVNVEITSLAVQSLRRQPENLARVQRRLSCQACGHVVSLFI